MLQNLHTHTNFCDGMDAPEKMVSKAIELGFDSLGFSSHAQTDEHNEYELRDVFAYTSEIERLKQKYAGKIDIYLGCEYDYYSLGVMPDYKFDYTIGSVHSARLADGTAVTYDHSYARAKKHLDNDLNGDKNAFVKLYYDTVADLPNRIPGFDIVGHFDLLTKYSEQYPDFIDIESDFYKKTAMEAFYAVREKKELFEVNTGAISRGYRTTPYPAPWILREMRKANCKIVLTSDCHDCRRLTQSFDDAKALIKASGFDTLYYLTSNGFVGKKLD